jgi:sec-independent protein translocase protein TatB
MFDVGFSEIIVIAVVALVVIGPERLPKVARTLGHLFGRMQRYVNDVKADIAREMELEELRKLQNSVKESARSIEQSVTREIDVAQAQLTSVDEALAKEAAAVQQQIEAKPGADAMAAVQPAAQAPAAGDAAAPSAKDSPGKDGSQTPA